MAKKQNGKGDKWRKDLDMDKYRDNFDKIFRKKTPPRKNKKENLFTGKDNVNIKNKGEN